MPLRVPPGRAGRLWLRHRLDIARRGAEVLDQKHRALLALQMELAPRLEEARVRFEEAAREAPAWLDRAATLSGERRVRLALLHAGAPATTRLEWRNTLGVVHPSACRVDLPGRVDVAALGGSAALEIAAGAHRRAVEAAAAYAVLRLAHARVAAELAATVRRARAIDRRWIPEHRGALAALELSLEESEREEAARTRWVTERSAAAGPAGAR
jgi:V/A-type H+/Na+-transporting ATPase subunit D